MKGRKRTGLKGKNSSTPIYFDRVVKEKLVTLAESQNMSVSGIVRDIVREYLGLPETRKFVYYVLEEGSFGDE